MKYFIITILIVLLSLYLFWIKLKKGKPGRISGEEVESKTYEEALVVDVRWRKEYERGHAVNAINLPIKLFKNDSKILDSYKDKEIILYCVVDVTSRNTEKLLRERGFANISIGDGVKQYNYTNYNFKNVLMAEMKYLRTILPATLLNVSGEELDKNELKLENELSELEQFFDKEKTIFVYGDNFDKSLNVSKELAEKGYSVIHLVEPMIVHKYTFTGYNKKDFIENNDEIPTLECG